MKKVITTISETIFGMGSVKKLQDRSNNIMNVFTKTVDDLSKVNEECVAALSERRAKITSLQAEADAIQSTKDANTKVITKITDFFKQ